MFAVLVNQCDRSRQLDAAGVVLNFLLHECMTYNGLSIAWGAPAEKWDVWRSRGQAAPSPATLRRLSSQIVRTRRVIVVDGNVDVQRSTYASATEQGNELTIETSKHTAVLFVSRSSRKMLWLGWYRYAGLDMVLAHPSRKAVEMATGRCGCLFDEMLQLWLVERRRGVWYELGINRVSMEEVRVDGG